MEKKKPNDVPTLKAKNALDLIAEKYHVSSDQLKITLKETVIKGATDAQFIAFCVVANSYNLNPLTREIFAFPDKRQGIIPIVSTDGWTKLITSHPEYKNHTFNYSDDTDQPEHGKLCPLWIECIIEKKDGSKTLTREYLDECYREPFIKDGKPLKGAWQSHTKRMLRHKAKIQAGRETFGFSGIYDADEGKRHIEAQVVEASLEDKEVLSSVKEKPEDVLPDTPPDSSEPLPEEETFPTDEDLDVSQNPMSDKQHKIIMMNFTTLGMGGHGKVHSDKRLNHIQMFAGVTVKSTKDLTEVQADKLIKILERQVAQATKK
jgi:phage recombination protein Bet